jgi:hypothetical protein
MNKAKTTFTILALILALPGEGAAQTLQFLATKASEDGTIQLKWRSETNRLYRLEFVSALAASNDWQTLDDDILSQGTNTLYVDTGKYGRDPEILHPKNAPQRFYRVAVTGTNMLAPPTVTLEAPAPGATLSGEITLTATVASPYSVVTIKLYVDGEEVAEIGSPENGTASYILNTTEWPNGPHLVFAVAKVTTGTETTGFPSNVQDGHAASVFTPVTFDNYVSIWAFSEPIFEPSLGESQHITAKFPAYSSWTLEIRDEFDTLVRSGSGTGYTMDFAWDGRDNGGFDLPDGEYQFSVNATESNPPPRPPPGGEGGGPPAPGGNLAMAADGGFGEGLPTTPRQALLAGLDSYFVASPPMPPVKKDGKWVPWEEVFGPLPPIQAKLSDKLIESLLLGDGGGQMALNGPEGAGGGGGAARPNRPPPKKIKGKPGRVGVAWQGHHPDTTNGIPGFTRPANIVGLITLDPNYVLPYGMIRNAKPIADKFASTMEKYGWSTAFNYGNDRITAPLLRKPSKGGSNLFNYCNIGLLVGHGIRGTTQDGRATSTPSLQTYFPIYRTGVNAYDWVRMSEFDFGGGPVGLRWMGIYACNILYRDNALDMYNKGVLPMNTSMHILCSAESSVFMYDTFGLK